MVGPRILQTCGRVSLEMLSKRYPAMPLGHLLRNIEFLQRGLQVSSSRTAESIRVELGSKRPTQGRRNVMVAEADCTLHYNNGSSHVWIWQNRQFVRILVHMYALKLSPPS
jgi:hypothetical protein